MQKSNGFLVLLALIAVILLGFIAGKIAEPPQVAPTYIPWPTYTAYPTFTPFPTRTPLPKATSYTTIASQLQEPLRTIAYNYPKVDGSTSTVFLAKFMYCAVFRLDCEWMISGGEPITYPNYVRITSGPSRIQHTVIPMDSLIKHSGTHDSYMNLVEGKSDIILVARMPSSDELVAANAKGVQFDVKPVALDAFVFIVHADNPVDTISIEQIRGIYTGKITNWSQIQEGYDVPIHAYQRDRNSGSQELMTSMIMGNTPILDAPDMILNTMAGPFYAIEGIEATEITPKNQEDRGGIGYSVYYYMWYMMGPRQSIKVLGIDGIRPTSNSIANETYPLISEVYVVIPSNLPKDNPALLLRDWLLSEQGQLRAVLNSGYIPIVQEYR